MPDEMIVYEYPIILDPDDNGTLLATCPDLPEVTTFGVDVADTLEHAVGAVAAAIIHRMQTDRDIPLPSQGGPGPRVALPPTLAGKAALYAVMRAGRITQTELATMIRRDRKVVQRLLNPTHGTAPEDIDAALRCVGLRLEVRVRAVSRAAAE